MDAPVAAPLLKPPPAPNANKVKQSDDKKGLSNKRKRAGEKASKKASKRPRSKNKALKPPVGVAAVGINASNHDTVLTNVGEGHKVAGKKRTKKNKKSSSGKKKQSKPRKPRKPVPKTNLSRPPEAFTKEIVGKESGQGFDSPREANDGGGLSEVSAPEMQFIHEKKSHYGDWQLEQETEGKIDEKNVEILSNVRTERMINWEHFALMYEEHCLTNEVIKR